MTRVCLHSDKGRFPAKKTQSNDYKTIHKPLAYNQNYTNNKCWGLGNAHRRGKREKTMQILALPYASTGYNLPTTIINPYKAKPKSKQFQKQIQKRNLNGERGEGGGLADANGSTRNAEFGSQDHSFGNIRIAVLGNRIPSTRSTVSRPA